MERPVVAIPMGDPAGIGPEIVIKSLVSDEINRIARCVVVGEARVLRRALAFPHMPRAEINRIDAPAQGAYAPGCVNVIDLQNIAPADFRIGCISGKCGQAAYAYIEKCVALALNKSVDAVATTPINKESLRLGGVPYIGHTEIFGALTRTDAPLTMFEVHGMRVFFLTRHMSLRQACDAVSKDAIVDCAARCWRVLRKLGVAEGVMAIAGLNPHSGEHGLFGDEEARAVAPAVEELRRQGYRVAGPIGADSVFHLALQGRYNSVLSLYHDQGHIAAKTLDFERTVAVTGGMPILRTSVDHGTAFDIAGAGTASSVSLEEAVRVAVRYAPHFGA